MDTLTISALESRARNPRPGACCPWSHGLRPKKLLVSIRVLPVPVRVPSQRPLAPSGTSVTLSDNDKDDNNR